MKTVCELPLARANAALHKTYYSIGGGFIVEEERFGQSHDVEKSVPYDFHSASELLTLCERQGSRFPV